jgi:hypothetical protein
MTAVQSRVARGFAMCIRRISHTLTAASAFRHMYSPQFVFQGSFIHTCSLSDCC